MEDLDGNRTIAKRIFNIHIKAIWTTKIHLNYFKNKFLRLLKHGSEKNLIIDDKLEFIPRELVKVRSKEEITSTLDNWGETERCAFLRIMYGYCDRTYPVYKTINYFYDETKKKLVKCKNIVVLEGVVCNGERRVFKEPCDRNCFLFWHTSWLEKIK